MNTLPQIGRFFGRRAFLVRMACAAIAASQAHQRARTERDGPPTQIEEDARTLKRVSVQTPTQIQVSVQPNPRALTHWQSTLRSLPGQPGTAAAAAGAVVTISARILSYLPKFARSTIESASGHLLTISTFMLAFAVAQVVNIGHDDILAADLRGFEAGQTEPVSAEYLSYMLASCLVSLYLSF